MLRLDRHLCVRVKKSLATPPRTRCRNKHLFGSRLLKDSPCTEPVRSYYLQKRRVFVHYGKTHVCRMPIGLPSAFHRALDKQHIAVAALLFFFAESRLNTRQSVCRVPDKKYSAKSCLLSKSLASDIYRRWHSGVFMASKGQESYSGSKRC